MPNWLADVEVDGHTHIGAQIITRKNVATLSRNGEVIAQRDDLVSESQPETRKAVMVFADGASWSAVMPQRKGGCGCS